GTYSARQAAGEQDDTRTRYAAIRRLEPEYAAQRCRDADRAIGVRPEAQRDQPRRDRRRRAARGAAGDARRIVRVVRRPVVRVLRREAERVLVHVEAADENGAGATERGDRRRVRAGGDATRGDGAGDLERGGGAVREAHRVTDGRSARARRRRAGEIPRAIARR